MKKLILFLALLVLPISARAMPATYGVDVAEVDGSPSVGAYKIVFPNGTLTCASGICTYAPSATSATFTDFYLSGPDVTHGMTSIAATSDYLAAFQIGSAGGADIYGMTEADQLGALRLTGIIGATDPTDSNPAVIFRGGKKNGTGWQALGAAETPFNFYNYTTSIGRAYGNGEWIFTAIENTPIGQSIARAGNFTNVAIGTALSFTALSSAPGSPVTGGIYLANNEAAGWDPCAIAGTTDYFVLYTGSAYVALWDLAGNILVSSIPVINWTIATLSDTTTPHTLTSAELKGTIISNVGAGEAHTFNAPAREAGWNFILLIEAAQNVIIDPDDTEAWYLNGTQLGAGVSIQNTAATVGESMTCYSTAAAVYCESKYTDWVVTP